MADKTPPLASQSIEPDPDEGYFPAEFIALEHWKRANEERGSGLTELAQAIPIRELTPEEERWVAQFRRALAGDYNNLPMRIPATIRPMLVDLLRIDSRAAVLLPPGSP